MKKGWRHEAGLAYIAVLFVLILLTVLGLGFVYHAATVTVTMQRRTAGLQAEYLAETAANHAVWRLNHDATFPPSSDNYYLHSLGAGRYGYKVVRPTESTFGSIATFGVVQDVVTKQSYVLYKAPGEGDLFTALLYSLSGGGTPQFRTFSDPLWAAPANALNFGDELRWIRMEESPDKSMIVMAGITEGNRLYSAAYTPLLGWNALSLLNHGSGISFIDGHAFDLAFESLSGHAIVFGRAASNDTDLKYSVWDGLLWSLLGPLMGVDLPARINNIRAMSDPTSDEILLAVVDVNADLYLIRWNGNGFVNHGVIETTVTDSALLSVDIAYESLSGDALIVWSGVGGIKYRIWNGTALSGTTDLGSTERKMVRLKADPTSDYIFVASGGTNSDLDIGLWGGSSIIDSRPGLEVNLAYEDRQSFDIAWESDGQHAMVIWSRAANNAPHFLRWEKGTTLASAAVQVGPDQSSAPSVLKLRSGPDNTMMFGCVTTNRRLSMTLWQDEEFATPVLMTNNLEAATQRSFDFIEPRY